VLQVSNKVPRLPFGAKTFSVLTHLELVDMVKSWLSSTPHSKMQQMKSMSESSGSRASGKEQPSSWTFSEKCVRRWMRSIRIYKIGYFRC
jgi:hypothetical protein